MTARAFEGRNAIPKGLWLTAAVLAAALCAAGPAFMISGADGLLGLAVAAMICLVPGWLVFAIHSRYGTSAPVAALLVGILGRMVLTLGGALAVVEFWPEVGARSLGLSLGILYMISLAIETKMLLAPLAAGMASKDET